MYIEFTLASGKAEFYRGIVNALNFFGGNTRAIIFDNLKAGDQRLGSSAEPSWNSCCAVTSICSHWPAKRRSDPLNQRESSKGAVCYLKGTPSRFADELIRFEDYLAFAPR